MRSSELHHLDFWTYRAHVPKENGPHPVTLLLHGWKGNEDVMWIFASRIPRDRLIIAPRALHEAPDSGYSWVDRHSSAFSTLPDFEPAVEALAHFLEQVTPSFEADFSKIDVMGFSQGAALTYAFSVSFPERIRSLAGLAGFMPNGVYPLAAGKPLLGIPAFVAHGLEDETVPIDMARTGADILKAAGAEVTYCEDEAGHKMGANCLRALSKFYENLP